LFFFFFFFFNLIYIYIYFFFFFKLIFIYIFKGNIRRCFKQQPEIRLKLYEYLLTMIDEYENIVPSIFEIVYNQV